MPSSVIFYCARNRPRSYSSSDGHCQCQYKHAYGSTAPHFQKTTSRAAKDAGAVCLEIVTGLGEWHPIQFNLLQAQGGWEERKFVG